MKRKHLLIAIPFFAALFIFSSLSSAREEYWIAYGGPPSDDAPSGGAKYLMKIDALGNILVQPRKVVRNSSVFVSPLGGSTAISHGGLGNLHIWFPSKHTLANGNHRVFKAVIEKSSLRLVSMGATRLSTSNTDEISVTQKPSNNFIVLQVLTNFRLAHHKWIAYSTSGRGMKWTSQECAGGTECSFGVSADGRVFFYSKRNDSSRFETYFQPLSPRGQLVGQPEIVVRGNDPREVLQAFDVSLMLDQTKRFYLYGGSGASLFLQVVDGRSGIRLGEKIRITGNVAEAVIDPLGRFIVYVTGAPSSKPLVFQGLDRWGNASGSAMIIATNIGGGIDILRESQ